ncbi:hypothetical protein K504DRAFT_503138 [Pleomassaria siparia CBS 279.74]|uniref:Zn(2)-C6 fungal-type domain-containing protein n=1 Tax=Pleomassaria siparia CBS 279.74 TaxID=1314801 RepID=A0A6G1K8J7_9PLEO|nr:hypothetical protein K504DRAFT_503138 [Pleomassaria siparia CBS 279.74]
MTASQVCVTCKGRKKKCDKRMPRCTYCEQKGLKCTYDYEKKSIPGPLNSGLQFSAFQNGLQKHQWKINHGALSIEIISSTSDPEALDARLSLEVIRIIAATHQTIDEIETRYFHGLHLSVPFFCPSRFRDDLIRYRLAPTAEFSLLLLCMCLTLYDPPSHLPPPIRRDTLYMHAKNLFTQVQILRKPSTHLIQAGIFVSLYEYALGRPDSALASIDICARMAYKIGAHETPKCPGWNEGWNTWWAIRIFERIFYCETSLTELPLITSTPNEGDPLPHEVDDVDCEERSRSSVSGQVAPVNRVGVGCLGRAAQATYLLDRVIQMVKDKAISATDQISSLCAMDNEMRELVSLTMNVGHGKYGSYCGAVGISIRALFMLHQHILELDTMAIGSQWQGISRAALDTVAHMTKDIAQSHCQMHAADLDMVPPIFRYLVRCTLDYLHKKRYTDVDAWFQDSGPIRESLVELNRRWPMETGLPPKY